MVLGIFSRKDTVVPIPPVDQELEVTDLEDQEKTRRVQQYTVEFGGPHPERNRLIVQGNWELLTLALLLQKFDPNKGEIQTQVKLIPGGKIVDIWLPKKKMCIEVHGLYWDWLKQSEGEKQLQKSKIARNIILERLQKAYVSKRSHEIIMSQLKTVDICFAFNPRQIIELFFADQELRMCLNLTSRDKQSLVTKFVRAAGELKRQKQTRVSISELEALLAKYRLGI